MSDEQAISTTQRNLLADYVAEANEVDRAYISETGKVDPSKAMVAMMLLARGEAPSAILDKLISIATGETRTQVLDGEGEVLSQKVDANLQLKAIEKLLAISGLDKASKAEAPTEINISFEELLKS